MDIQQESNARKVVPVVRATGPEKFVFQATSTLSQAAGFQLFHFHSQQQPEHKTKRNNVCMKQKSAAVVQLFFEFHFFLIINSG